MQCQPSEGAEQQQIPAQECPEGQVFDEVTMQCQPSEGAEQQQIPAQECPEGQVFDEVTMQCQPSEGAEQQIPADQKPPTTTTGQQSPPPATDLEQLTDKEAPPPAATTGQKAPPPAATTGQKAPPPAATDLEQLTAPKKSTATLEDLIGGDAKAGASVVPVGKNEVCKITKLDLKSGDTGDDISIIQKNLKELGYYPYDVIDKKFGSQTEMSVRLFQISNKLPVTGIVDKTTQEKICTASTDKNKHKELILNNFVKNPNVSTLDLLKDGQKFKQFKWHANDYIGLPKGPNENEAVKLVNSLKNIILEDRVTLSPNAILSNATYQQDKIRYNDYFYKQTQQMKDFPSQRMNKHAIVWFDKMREAAKADGIEIVPLSVWRAAVADEKRAKGVTNPYAIGGISHALGVTVDIDMSDGNKKYQPKTPTIPFSTVVDMRSSSIHKWLVIFANDFNFYPYTHEPWHWEYNYKNFKDVFLSEFKK
jgi:peptidoglycan hydrolase-like protein with peptidoglycan-binding domain